MSQTLDLCPFCKAAPCVEPQNSSLPASNSERWMQFVWCENCNAQGPLRPTAADAIAAWNRRAALPPPEGEWPVGDVQVIWYDPDQFSFTKPVAGKELDWSLATRDRAQLGDRFYSEAQVRQILAAAPQSPMGEGTVGVTGWLLEWMLRTGPEWWSLTETKGDGGYFTKDSLKALRFARKEDAQAYIDDAGWTEIVPTEHEWSDPPALSPSRQGTGK